MAQGASPCIEVLPGKARHHLPSGGADPGNAGWQAIVVSYNKIGDVLVDQGNLRGAEIVRDGLAIRDVCTADRQRGLAARSSVSYERVGDVLVAQGNLPRR